MTDVVKSRNESPWQIEKPQGDRTHKPKRRKVSKIIMTQNQLNQEFVASVLIAEEKGEQFPIDFDEVYRSAGYSRKDSAKRALLKQLIENEDYVIDSTSGWNRSDSVIPGSPEYAALMRTKVIRLSVNGFEKFKSKSFLTRPVKRDEKVYFILNRQRGVVKIGFSIDPERRLTALEEGTVDDLELIGITLGGRKEELIIHKKFAQYWIRREWFVYSDEIKAYVKSLRIQ